MQLVTGLEREPAPKRRQLDPFADLHSDRAPRAEDLSAPASRAVGRRVLNRTPLAPLWNSRIAVLTMSMGPANPYRLPCSCWREQARRGGLPVGEMVETVCKLARHDRQGAWVPSPNAICPLPMYSTTARPYAESTLSDDSACRLWAWSRVGFTTYFSPDS